MFNPEIIKTLKTEYRRKTHQLKCDVNDMIHRCRRLERWMMNLNKTVVKHTEYIESLEHRIAILEEKE